MKTVVIPQVRTGFGSIHMIASTLYDREIRFPKGHKYAVVLASYYGGRGYTTHKTELTAIKATKRNREFSHVIIDSDGRPYDIEPDGYTGRDSLVIRSL